MYLQYFGLNEAPFSITPDPAFVYLSPEHREALAHLLYGVGQGGSGGFVQLTGEVGTGKTTLCRCLLEQVGEDTRVALVLNPLLTPSELLETICGELGIPTEGIAGSNKAMVDALNRHLLAQHADGHRVVVVIDEAYIDFGGDSAVRLIDRYDNLLVVQTLSKSRSLAGMRIGLALGNADLLEGLIRVKDSFNSYPIDRLALAAGIAAFEDEEYFQRTCRRVTIRWRSASTRWITQRHGWSARRASACRARSEAMPSSGGDTAATRRISLMRPEQWSTRSQPAARR